MPNVDEWYAVSHIVLLNLSMVCKYILDEGITIEVSEKAHAHFHSEAICSQRISSKLRDSCKMAFSRSLLSRQV